MQQMELVLQATDLSCILFKENPSKDSVFVCVPKSNVYPIDVILTILCVGLVCRRSPESGACRQIKITKLKILIIGII